MAKLKIYILGISIALMMGIYLYQDIVTYPPQSIHRWRQTDCLSICQNYYNNGFHFFKPEVHNQNSNDKTEGKGVGECPYYYFLIAFLFKIFGPYYMIFRIVNILIVFTGLIYIFKLLEIISKSFMLSLFGTLFIFTSTSLVYYTNNFLTDPIGLSLIVIGLYYYFKFREKELIRYFIVFCLFAVMAMLLKITSGLGFVAAIGVLIISFVFKNWFKDEVPDTKKYKLFIPVLISVLIIAAWYAFAIKYNTENKSTYFSTKTWPLWSLTGEEIKTIFKVIWNYNLGIYFHFSMHLFILAALIFTFYYHKVLQKSEKLLLIALLFGNVLFFIMWYYAFWYHDYYIINLLIVPAFIFAFAFKILNIKYPKIATSKITAIVLSAFLILNVLNTRKEMKIRYNGWPVNELQEIYGYYFLQPYLQQLGIQYPDKVISLPDTKPSHTLYLMNLKGWTGFYAPDTKEEIDNYIEKEAQYLIYHGDLSERYQFLEEYMHTKIGQFGNIAIYNLQDTAANFIEYNPVVEFEIKKDSSNAILSNVKKGDLYLVSVKLKSKDKVSLVVSADDPNQLFIKDSSIIITENAEWNELKTFVYVHRYIKNKKLTVTLKSDSDQELSYKNLTIIKIKDSKKVVL